MQVIGKAWQCPRCEVIRIGRDDEDLERLVEQHEMGWHRTEIIMRQMAIKLGMTYEATRAAARISNARYTMHPLDNSPVMPPLRLV